MKTQKRKNLDIPIENEIGLSFYNLTIKEKTRIKTKRGNEIFYIVKCVCGVEKLVSRGNMKNGTTKSCGSPKCCGQEKHGIFSNKKTNKRPDEYVIWDNILRRCKKGTKQNQRGQYSEIFKKTIALDDSWRSYENFFKDMGPRPSKKHSIDRIDNSKGYSKENCRWATHSEQMRNTCRNVFYYANGVKLCREDLAKLVGADSNTIRYHEKRLNKKDFNKYISARFKINISKI